MKFKSWDGAQEHNLLKCPFCGTDPKIKHIVNDHSRSRTIEISCPGCRIRRADSGITRGFEWLENVAVTNWNQRP